MVVLKLRIGFSCIYIAKRKGGLAPKYVSGCTERKGSGLIYSERVANVFNTPAMSVRR